MAKKKESKRKNQNSSSLREENNELKYELKKIKKNKKQNTHNILMAIYIILAITSFIKTESGYVFFGAIALGVVFHAFLDHVLEIDKE